jgi:hypothetical protein
MIYLKIGINAPDYTSNITPFYNFAGKNPAIFVTELNGDASAYLAENF